MEIEVANTNFKIICVMLATLRHNTPPQMVLLNMTPQNGVAIFNISHEMIEVKIVVMVERLLASPLT